MKHDITEDLCKVRQANIAFHEANERLLHELDNYQKSLEATKAIFDELDKKDKEIYENIEKILERIGGLDDVIDYVSC